MQYELSSIILYILHNIYYLTTDDFIFFLNSVFFFIFIFSAYCVRLYTCFNIIYFRFFFFEKLFFKSAKCYIIKSLHCRKMANLKRTLPSIANMIKYIVFLCIHFVKYLPKIVLMPFSVTFNAHKKLTICLYLY